MASRKMHWHNFGYAFSNDHVKVILSGLYVWNKAQGKYEIR